MEGVATPTAYFLAAWALVIITAALAHLAATLTPPEGR